MKNKKILLIVLLVIFLLNTFLAGTNAILPFDNAIHSFMYNFYSSFTIKFMKTITFFGSTAWVVSLCTLLFIIYSVKKSNKSYIVALILIISTLLNNGIKFIVRRARPLNMLIVENTFSYPSGHMMASTTIYGILIYFLIKSNIAKKYKIIYASVLSLLIVLIGLSRIFLRAHFFTDVFGGALVSSMLIILVSILNDKYKWIKD